MISQEKNEALLSLLNKSLDFVIESKGDKESVESAFLLLDDDAKKANSYFLKLSQVAKMLDADLEFFMDSDPAVISKEEIIIAYPGFKAISYYRIAHVLRDLGLGLYARIITEKAHSETGIDIHPGAKISSPFFIDHGTGIVIGETAIVGKYVKIYQGVTLGALSLANARSLKGVKRHPTIGDNVTIYAGASILGAIKVGDNVTIGSNVFVVDNVPSNVRVMISKPDLIVKKID